jgi:hypothetical protein
VAVAEESALGGKRSNLKQKAAETAEDAERDDELPGLGLMFASSELTTSQWPQTINQARTPLSG